MIHLFFLFIIVLVGMTLRYFILGQFEWIQFLYASLFLLAAFAIGVIEKWQQRKEATYEPVQPHDHTWYIKIMDRFSPKRKVLFKGNEKVGEYHRFYKSKWQYWLSEIFLSPSMYLYMKFTFYHNHTIIVEKQNKKKGIVNDVWNIVEDGNVIGTLRTDITWKNAAKLKGGLILSIHDKTFYFRSLSVQSKVNVLKEDEVIATGKRALHQFQYEFEVEKGYEQIEPYLVITYILFHYVFK
jgi:hypothetical protein